MAEQRHPTAWAEGENILTAKLAVMKLVPYVRKKQPDRKRGEGVSYSYTAEEGVLARLRPAMLDHGIVVCPVAVEAMDQTEYRSKSGGPMARCRLKVTFRFTHVASGTYEDCVVVGEGADVGDKSSPKANTGSLKYALRQFFLLRTGDDPDKTPSGRLQRGEGRPGQAQEGPQPARQDAQGHQDGQRAPSVEERHRKAAAWLRAARDADELEDRWDRVQRDEAFNDEEVDDLGKVYKDRMSDLDRPGTKR